MLPTALLLVTSAFAGPPDTLADTFVDAVSTSDGEGAKALCSDEFRSRSGMGCDALVELLLKDGSVTRGRLAASESEALVELWLTSRGERFPIRLLARPEEGEWRFVDGTDVDGPALKTELSLDGKEDPGALPLPRGMDGFFEGLRRVPPEIECTTERTQLCEDLAKLREGEGIDFRPVSIVLNGKKAAVVHCLVEAKGRARDEAWLHLVRVKKKRWKLNAIAEEP